VARHFVSGDGLAILVGRNNAANDELTLRIARPEDLWLHVEGYGGSHVVVRRGGRAEVPRQTLVDAAQLAAYYSQARGQRKVPVHYTLRKHVRKPKGAKPGLVTITQEKTILATADPEVVRRLAARAHEPAD
jgi:predicted ribosome quality control (RQC) complex YloA/Tae2 family protein